MNEPIVITVAGGFIGTNTVAALNSRGFDRVYTSEVSPERVRAKGQSLGTSIHWIMNALISGTFLLLAAKSSGYPFLFFGFMVVCQFLVVLLTYPDTKKNYSRTNAAEVRD